MRRPALLIALSLAWPALAAAPQERFDAANDLYLEGRVEEAITAWGALRASGELCSPDVEYNLGTAYLERDDLGRAVFHLERAALLSAADHDARHNLDLARSRALGTGGDLSDVVVPGWDRVLRQVPFGRIVSPFLVSWVVLFLLLILRHLATDPRARRRLAYAAAVALVLVAAGGVVLLGALHARHGIRRGILLEEDSHAREMPDAVAPVVFTAPAGTEVRVFERERGFVRVRLPNGIAAWVPEEQVGEL